MKAAGSETKKRRASLSRSVLLPIIGGFLFALCFIIFTVIQPLTMFVWLPILIITLATADHYVGMLDRP